MKVILKVGGMSCSACSSGLEKYLNKQKGVLSAQVNLVMAQASIEYEGISIDDLERFIKEAGFESLGVYLGEKEEQEENSKTKFILFGLLAVLVLYIAMAPMMGLPIVSYLDKNKYPLNYAFSLLILTIPFFTFSMDIFQSGIKNLYHKMPNMDTLVSLGVFTSLAYSLFSIFMMGMGHLEYVEKLYFESCALVLFFIKIGREIEHRSQEKTKEALKDLVQITPSKATMKKGKKEIEVTLDEIKKGDILISKPGEKIAVDGVIVKGNAHFDEAFITGEARPISKKEEDKVIAGSINFDGYIEYKAEKIGKDSMISEIVRLVVEATNTKSKIQRQADRVCSYFVPVILGIALASFLGYCFFQDPSRGLNAFVTTLVVACPCALGLATPLAIVISEGVCAKRGILVKSSEVLENAHKVDTIVFDKTGTLTYGNLKIGTIKNLSNYKEKELMTILCSLEKASTHPIAKAFHEEEVEKKLKLKEVTNFKNFAGFGIIGEIEKKTYAIGNYKLLGKLKIKNDYLKEEELLAKEGKSIVYAIEEKKIIALLGIEDMLRESAKETIHTLKKMNKRVLMLTGDHFQTAQVIAQKLGNIEVIADVLPKEKNQVIQDLLKEGKVMMVGDGINDAPSLAISTVGVSIHSGTDIAMNSADIVLLNDRLEKIPELLQISQKTFRNIKQNLFWAFFYNLCMIPIAIGLFTPFGITMNPMMASIAMTLSSLTVVANSLRLKKVK